MAPQPNSQPIFRPNPNQLPTNFFTKFLTKFPTKFLLTPDQIPDQILNQIHTQIFLPPQQNLQPNLIPNSPTNIFVYVSWLFLHILRVRDLPKMHILGAHKIAPEIKKMSKKTNLVFPRDEFWQAQTWPVLETIPGAKGLDFPRALAPLRLVPQSVIHVLRYHGDFGHHFDCHDPPHLPDASSTAPIRSRTNAFLHRFHSVGLGLAHPAQRNSIVPNRTYLSHICTICRSAMMIFFAIPYTITDEVGQSLPVTLMFAAPDLRRHM